MRELVLALATFSALAFAVTAPAWLGRGAVRPERWFDFDPLYRLDLRMPNPPPLTDYSSTVLDLPRDLTIAHALRAGDLRHWNPLSGCGVPLWAEQAGPLFPLKLPLYLYPSLVAYDLFLTLRLIVAGLGAFLLARYRGLQTLAALAAGAAFELSGPLLEAFPYGSTSAFCVLPFVILGATAIAARPGGAGCAGAALALGVAGSGGHPSFVFLVYLGYGMAIAGHVAAAIGAPRRALSIAAWGVLALVLGLALAAPSLLPLAELASVGSTYKHREIGQSVWTTALRVSRNSIAMALFAPHVLASIHKALLVNHTAEYALGIVSLVLAVAGVLRAGLDAGLWGMAGLGVVLSTAPPGLAWIAQLPGVSIILPKYAGILVVLPLTQALGAGVEALRDERRGRALGVALALVLAGVASLRLVQNISVPSGVLPLRDALDGALGAAGGRLRLALPLSAAATVVGLWWVLRGRRAARWIPLGAVLLAIAEQVLLWPAILSHERSQALRSDPSRAVRALQAALAGYEARFTGVPVVVGHGLTPMLHGLRDVRSVAALAVGRYQAYAHAFYPSQFATLQDFPLQPQAALLDLAAVRYIALQDSSDFPGGSAPRPTADTSMVIAYEEPHLVIYENRAALARARIVHRADRVANEAQARAAILWMGRQLGHAAQLGLADHVVVEPDATGAFPPPLDGRVLPGEWVRIVDERDPDRLVLEANLETPGLVTVADTYYPAWRATIDGQPAPIYPANLAFRALYVPPGQHTIVFRYEPRAFRAGCLAAAAAAAVCLALAARQRRRRDS
jgi:hypothetical protein